MSEMIDLNESAVKMTRALQIPKDCPTQVVKDGDRYPALSHV